MRGANREIKRGIFGVLRQAHFYPAIFRAGGGEALKAWCRLSASVDITRRRAALSISIRRNERPT